MLKFLARNIDITDVFKAVILATLKSYKTKALTKAYSLILDNLDDSHDPTFEMIQRACVRKLRRSHARGADRSPERRPATPPRIEHTRTRTSGAPRTSRVLSPMTSLLSWSTSLPNAASRLGRFSRTTTFLPPYTGSKLDLIHGQVHPFHGIE